MAIAKWKQFTDEQIANFVKECTSFVQLQKKMGYTGTSGSATQTLEKVLIEKGIDYSHFKGHAWNKKEDKKPVKHRDLNRPLSQQTVKNLFIQNHEYKCECCGISEWNGKPITLQLHHKDGNHNNNEEENLSLLCPNCHSQTESFCGKKNTLSVSDEEFLGVLLHSTSICAACRELGISPNQSNYKRARRLLNSDEG